MYILRSDEFFLCSARADRYNHEEAEDTEEDAEDIMFNSFSSCSPHYSQVYQKFEELREVLALYSSVFLTPKTLKAGNDIICCNADLAVHTFFAIQLVLWSNMHWLT